LARKVAPSQMVREQLEHTLCGGVEAESNLLFTLAQLGMKHLVQQALEQEQQDYLGRDRYERRSEKSASGRGYRNGYEEAGLSTAEGKACVRAPQVRGVSHDGEPYRSGLMEFLQNNSEALERLVTEMYARGLSTRDVEDCFKDLSTGKPLLSRTAVSEITDQLWEDYRTFCERDLSGIEVQYLFVDAVYESLRRYGAKEGIFCAWAITTEGSKVLLHLAVGNKESVSYWTEFFRDMIRRGLRTPTSVTSDGAPGLIQAIEQVFKNSLRIRCWFHKLSNIRAKIPEEASQEFMAHVRAVRDAPTYVAGEAAAATLIDSFSDTYPAAVRCFSENLDASLAHLKLPVRHRINVRTTNLLERSFVEERRRSKVIPRFTDEKSATKLVFATLIRASERWSRVSVSELERKQLGMLRQELGIDPPPERDKERDKEVSNNRGSEVA
jgi:putative transposase